MHALSLGARLFAEALGIGLAAPFWTMGRF